MRNTVPSSETVAPDLLETASEWLVRRQDAGWSARDESELQHWLAADPLRRQVFDRLSRTWGDFSAVPRPVLASGRHGEEAAARVQAASSRGGFGWPARRAFVPAALALGVLLATGGWYRWEHTPGYTWAVATGPAEMRTLDLPDGSRIDLNGASRLVLRFYPHHREAVLEQGEAFFEVAADAERPFTVDSGVSRVTVVGTRFNVRAASPRLVVKVLEGRVLVTPDREQPGRQVALEAAQGVAVEPSGGAWQPVRALAESVGDWRSGRLVFRQVPMAEVAQEVARYLGQPVVVEGGAALKALPVSGFADTRAPGAFLDALPDLLPVRVQRPAEGGYLITSR